MTHKTKKKGTTLRTLHYFWQEVKRYKWHTLLAFTLTPLIVYIRAVLAPQIFADLIDKASQGYSAEQMVELALGEVLIFIVLYALNKAVLEELQVWACWKMEVLAMYDLANLCFNTISAQSMQFHNDRFAGSLVSQTNKFVGAYEILLDVIIWEILPTASFIIMVIAILGPQVPWFAIGIIILTALYIIILKATQGKISRLKNEVTEAETRQTGQLADSISNMISVKSYARETHERHRFANFSHKVFTTNMASMRSFIVRDVKFSIVQIGITALILVFLLFGREWLGISVALLVLIVNYAQTILGELWNINGIFKNLSRSMSDAHEMTLILDLPDDVVDEPGAKPLELQRAAVDFNHISFQHSDAKEAIFEDFSLSIQPGERVGLVGVSGSGKTTLTKLLLRFADVTAGEITISGQNIKNVTQKSLREAIAYVPQETSLFHRSIAENIAYGKPDASIDEIKAAARLANADDFIRELPDGYDTLVGERGIKLSGGQRQRVAIARAILKDAPILVLDEATSALDSESEALIQGALEELMKGRTSIVIAHRLSTVASLDRIVVLQDGRIVEQGTHQDLLKSGGIYEHLWSRQSGAFMKD